MTRKIKTREEGFTLVEMIIYVALTAIFISAAIIFAWNVIYSGTKSSIQREVNQNIRLAMKRIGYEIRNASEIISIGNDDLCLASVVADRNPTRIYSFGGRLRIAWGGGAVSCTGMVNDEALTSNQLTLTDLNFINRSNGVTTNNVSFSLTVSSSGDREEWNKTSSFFGSAELRSN